jgi:hypothetical protein
MKAQFDMRNRDGSVLVLVLVIAVGTGLIISSLSKLAMTEREFNDQSRMVIEAKEAAEATVECGFAQLMDRFQTSTSFGKTALVNNPLKLTSDFYDMFEDGSGMAKTRVKLPSYPYNAGSNWGSQETELIAGMHADGWVRKFIDPTLPANKFDPMKGKWILAREVEVFGKATVKSVYSDHEYTSYVTQRLQVRDAPLFTHAIFYNMDMEIAPGPDMDVKGPVHANGNMYIQANASLDFYSNLTATNHIFHGPNPSITKGKAYGKVTMTDGTTQLSMKDGSTWVDNKLSDFRSRASGRWNGYVQCYDHGIQYQNLVAVDDYVADDPHTGGNELRNYAYQIIQPVKNKKDADYNEEIERQKFALKAGLVVEVDPDDGSYEIYTYNLNKSGEVRYLSNGDPRRRNDFSLSGGDEFITVETYGQNDGTVDSGLYDKRMGGGINIVEVDVNKLREVINNNDKNDWGYTKNWAMPSRWWNGVVYVQIGEKDDFAGEASRPDGVVPANASWGVKLINGSKIPNPSRDPDVSSSVQEAFKSGVLGEDDSGMTFATNAPLYVDGNYNADGDKDTGSATDPDATGVENEPPAAIIADAVTILSNDWDDSKSASSMSNRRASDFTEVAAAILTGLVPSDKNNWNNYSGGVENFPRFLENWSGKTFRYRGSMVALFESEVATEKWGKGDVYSAPRRDWGFHSLFASGEYPPGTPNTRSYRRINYRNLTEAEYAVALDKLATVAGVQ